MEAGLSPCCIKATYSNESQQHYKAKCLNYGPFIIHDDSRSFIIVAGFTASSVQASSAGFEMKRGKWGQGLLIVLHLLLLLKQEATSDLNHFQTQACQ